MTEKERLFSSPREVVGTVTVLAFVGMIGFCVVWPVVHGQPVDIPDALLGLAGPLIAGITKDKIISRSNGK